MSRNFSSLRLGWRQMRRDLAAGDIRILLAALVLAVVAVTSVGFLTDRAQRTLAMEANRLLGADAMVRADAPIDATVRRLAVAAGLKQAETVELTSMLRTGQALQLGDLRALGAGFPLRGAFGLAADSGAVPRPTQAVPARGTVWLSRDGASRLGVAPGGVVGVGDRSLRIAALVVAEPDAATDYFNVAPRAFLNLEDLESTGLVQEGSRLEYRLGVAGPPAAVERFVKQARAVLGRGQRIETSADGRPEIRSALDRAGRFLSLAALVSVVLAAIAVAMAARRHSARHLQGAAVMRCLGASQRTLLAIHLGELLWLGLIASTLGIAIAWLLQLAVGSWLAASLRLTIPPAGWLPAIEGLAVGLVVLLAFAAPPVLALRRVSALRVLRRETDNTEPGAWLVALAGLLGIALLLWWKAGSAELGTAMLTGIAGTLAALSLLAVLALAALRALRGRLRGPLRFGLANVTRRAGSAVAQIAALGLGLMALLLLTLVRTNLLDRWQLQLAVDAPNRFVINAQPDQIDPIRGFVAQRGMAPPELWPMVRGRLLSRNGAEVDTAPTADASAADDETVAARRWEERAFNLSSTREMRADNRVTAGRFWAPEPTVTPEFSVEEDFARRLDWKVGDQIAFDIAGQTLSGRITSLRQIDWESFKPNFFVLASPGALDGFAASYVTALRVEAGDSSFTRALIERFPNLSVIDVDRIISQVRATADQVSRVVEIVFYFALAAGVLVLLASISASQDERLLEGSVMRALGASRGQLRLAQFSEFFAIGLLAGLTAAFAASVLAEVIATRVFNLPWQASGSLVAIGAALGVAAAVIAGMLATRRVVDAPPMGTLRDLQA